MEKEPLCEINKETKLKRGRPCKKKEIVEEHEEIAEPVETMEEIAPCVEEIEEELIKPKLKRARTSAQIVADKKLGELNKIRNQEKKENNKRIKDEEKMNEIDRIINMTLESRKTNTSKISKNLSKISKPTQKKKIQKYQDDDSEDDSDDSDDSDKIMFQFV